MAFDASTTYNVSLLLEGYLPLYLLRPLKARCGCGNDQTYRPPGDVGSIQKRCWQSHPHTFR